MRLAITVLLVSLLAMSAWAGTGESDSNHSTGTRNGLIFIGVILLMGSIINIGLSLAGLGTYRRTQKEYGTPIPQNEIRKGVSILCFGVLLFAGSMTCFVLVYLVK